MAKTDLETLVVTFEASITKFERSMQKMLATSQGATGRTKKNFDDAMKGIEQASGRAADTMDRNLKRASKSQAEFGRQVQNQAFQVGDFFVQIASGQDAFRAAAQQLPQLLGGMGVIGAVAGAAVAALAAVIGQMDLFGSSASVNAEDLKTFNEALKDSKVSADIADDGYDALILKLGKLTAVTREALVATLQQSIEKNTDALKSGATDLTGKLEDQWQELVHTIGGTGEEAFRAREHVKNLIETLKLDPTNTDAYTQLAMILRDLAQRSTGETSEAFRKLANEMSIAAGNAVALSDKNQRYQAIQRIVNGEVRDGDKALVNAGTSADDTATKMDKLAGSVDGVGLAFGRLAGKTTAGFGGIQDVFEKQRQKGLTIPDRPDGGALGPQFNPNQSPADIEVDPRSQAILDALAKPLKTPKAKAAKKTPTDRAEDKAQQLRDEIAYNEKLAGAYALGEAAIRKITAAYEALKAARQAGLKDGTAEFQKYVDEATASNLVNLELEHRLDLMKQGKALSESVMTDEEKRTKLLADYLEMLRAGAIDTTVYDRAVAKAKDQNDALKDAIGGVGDAIQSGIQGATSFADALTKIGLQLLSLAARGLFGEGPFGGLFNKLLGVAAGGVLGTATATAGIGAPTAGLGTGFRRSYAAGGMAGPGPFLVGENGPEILSTAQRGHVMPAQATRRLLSGSGGASSIAISVNGARGNQEIMQMVATGVAEGVRQSGRNVPGIQKNYTLRFA